MGLRSVRGEIGAIGWAIRYPHLVQEREREFLASRYTISAAFPVMASLCFLLCRGSLAKNEIVGLHYGATKMCRFHPIR